MNILQSRARLTTSFINCCSSRSIVFLFVAARWLKIIPKITGHRKKTTLCKLQSWLIRAVDGSQADSRTFERLRICVKYHIPRINAAHRSILSTWSVLCNFSVHSLTFFFPPKKSEAKKRAHRNVLDHNGAVHVNVLVNRMADGKCK